MSKVLIVYGSTTGMTELVAFEVEKTLKSEGLEVEIKNVIEANATELFNCENILFGVSTWDFGCLQYDFEPFHEELKNMELSHKSFAVFGTGDKAYGDTYCEAVRIVEKTCLEKGWTEILPRMEVECDLTEDRLEQVRKWSGELARKLKI